MDIQEQIEIIKQVCTPLQWARVKAVHLDGVSIREQARREEVYQGAIQDSLRAVKIKVEKWKRRQQNT